MTAPLPEKTTLHVAEVDALSSMSSKLAPDMSYTRLALIDYKGQLERICSYANPDEYACMLDLSMILIDGIDQLIDEDRNLSTHESDFLKKFSEILSEYILLPNSKLPDAHLLYLFKDPQWVRPITENEEKGLLDLLDLLDIDDNIKDSAESKKEEVELNDVIDFSSFNQTSSASSDASEEIELTDILNDSSVVAFNASSVNTHMSSVSHEDNAAIELTDNNPANNSNEGSVNSNQQELIDLIRAELAELIDNNDDIDYGPDQYQHKLTCLADQAENIGNAALLIGLEGLSSCCFHVSKNINLLAQSDELITQDQKYVLEHWPIKFLGYLQDLNDTQRSGDIVILLQERAWPSPITDGEVEQLQSLLKNPVFIEEEKEVRQDEASEDDVSLALPDDVNPELLEGLLQDLPSQSEEFSAAIQNIYENGNIDDIDTAQRIAHTLKGAANVVGVKGIANLTHHLEDILQAQSKANKLPVKALAETLVRAADCLESMTETLLGIDTQPVNAVGVLQDVLSWANKLDNENYSDEAFESIGLSNSSETDREVTISESEETSNEPSDFATKEKSQKNISTENVLRIPASLADELLRLAGENLISTSQVQENIKTVAKRLESLDLHNQSLQQLSFDLEHQIDIRGFSFGATDNNTDGVFDPLELNQYHEVHTISRRLVEIAADSVELSQVLDRDLTALKELIVSQDHLQKESEELILRTKMVPIKTIIQRLKRGVRQACRVTGKQVELIVEDNNTHMDSEILNNMIESLMHILRNAVDHGIEEPQIRVEKGKNAIGTINLKFERVGNQILIDIIDDGYGLNTEKIYSKALSSKLINSDQDLSDENIFRLILEPSFSTRSEVTHTSGRGIGLDVVNVKIRELKGSIDIQSKMNKGCHFTISLPISSFSTHALLVRVRQHIYAISSRSVEEIIYPGVGVLRDLSNETIYQLGNQAYSVALLDTLLSLPVDRRNIERNNRPIILVKDESGSKTAVLVQEVIDSRQVVVKNMGKYIPRLNGIIGATVLGDGSVAPVIDLPELLHDSSLHKGIIGTSTQDDSDAQSKKLPYILVVDDSLSARRSLAQFVEDMGFTVRTARDGMEAINLIEANKPDLLLVDMEMPKMNGLELTSHVRASPDIQNIPVIMITSRSSEKHQNIALDKGVNHYMVKPFDEDELAQHINTMLEIA